MKLQERIAAYLERRIDYCTTWQIARIANELIGPGEGYLDSYTAEDVRDDKETFCDDILNALSEYEYSSENMIIVLRAMGFADEEDFIDHKES